MLYLSPDKLNSLLAARRMTLSQLSRHCGISRQSVYDMFGKKPVFNSTFVKIMEQLGVTCEQLTESRDDALLRAMPMRIQKAVTRLIQFCDTHHAGLILFGSRARGKVGVQPDWDFAVYASHPIDQKTLSLLKHQLVDTAFPHRLDLVNLNAAPDWFLESIAGDFIQLHGKQPFTVFVERKAA